MSAPRVVLAAPLYNQAEHLDAALHSLRSQTYGDFALVLVDDASSDATAMTARRHAAADERLQVHVNPRRLGMLENTNRAWALARELFPDSEFQALASDHDVWAAGWLDALVGALEGAPAAVLAYPLTERIDDAGRLLTLRRWRCDTAGIAAPVARLRRAYRCMVAGDMVYGLYRAAVLDGRPLYDPVLVPDRLLLSELALRGEFVQVPEVLWYRRFAGLADLERQRRAFWPQGPPRYARAPWWLVHPGFVLAKGGGARLAATLLAEGLALRARRRLQAGRRRAGGALERPARAAMRRSRAVRRTLTSERLPLPADTRDVLRRLAAEDDD